MRQTITAAALVLLVILVAFSLGYNAGYERSSVQASVATPPAPIAEMVVETRAWIRGDAERVNAALADGWSIQGVSTANFSGGASQTRVYHLIKRH